MVRDWRLMNDDLEPGRLKLPLACSSSSLTALTVVNCTFISQKYVTHVQIDGIQTDGRRNTPTDLAKCLGPEFSQVDILRHVFLTH